MYRNICTGTFVTSTMTDLETTPLSSSSSSLSSKTTAKTTTLMMGVTLCKTSIGTGVLALPYTFGRGGVVTMGVTLMLLAWWNEWCGLKVMESVALLSPLEKRRYDSSRESPFATLMRAAVGSVGAYVVDVVFVILVFGVVTSYLVAAHDSAGPVLDEIVGDVGRADVFAAALFSLPLTLVSDIGQLAPVAILGLGALIFAFSTIVYYLQPSDEKLEWWIAGDASAWASGFGVMSFCFGLVPIVPQFVAAMEHPSEFKPAQRGALMVTVLIYLVLGIVVAYLDPSVPGNVLFELPPTAPAALAARTTIGIVCIASAPLPVVAGAEIMEKHIPPFFGLGFSLRVLLLFSAAFVADKVPEFAVVVAVVGAAAVSFLSFVLPPVIHFRLLAKRQRRHRQSLSLPNVKQDSVDDPRHLRGLLILDAVFSVLGLLVVVFVTALVTSQAIASLRHPSSSS